MKKPRGEGGKEAVSSPLLFLSEAQEEKKEGVC